LQANSDAWFIFGILLTQSVDTNVGILKFDPQLVRSLCDLLEVGESAAIRLSGKLLYMIDVANEKRLAKKENRPSDDMKGRADGE
jgi:uncharacterized lipoprotein YbaY